MKVMKITSVTRSLRFKRAKISAKRKGIEKLLHFSPVFQLFIRFNGRILNHRTFDLLERFFNTRQFFIVALFILIEFYLFLITK